MRKWIVIVLVALCCGLAQGAEKNGVMTLEQLEDLSLNVGGVKLNNFMFVERAALGDVKMKAKVSIRAKETTKNLTPVAVYMSGLDAEGKLVACFCLRTVLGISKGDSGELDCSGVIPAGSLKRIKKVQLRIVVNN